MTNTVAFREIDPQQAFAMLRPLRWELGVRDCHWMSDSSQPHLGSWVEFKIGTGRSTANVKIRLTAADTFNIDVFQVRKVRGHLLWEEHLLAELFDVYVEQVCPALLAAWCRVCSEKGW